MFASRTRVETVIRVLLMAVVVFNALVPTTTTVQAEQESSSKLDSNSSQKKQVNRSIPTFERPESRLGDNSSSVSLAERTQVRNPASPLMFIENVGQFDSRALFTVQGSKSNIYLSKDAIWFTIIEKTKREKPDKHPLEARLQTRKKAKVVNLKMVFPGSNPGSRLEPFDSLGSQVSYLVGSESAKHFSNVPVWSGVRYVDLFPGVDLELTGEDGSLIWRVVVRDSARFSQNNHIRSQGLRIKIEGQKRLDLINSELRVGTDLGNFALPQVQVTGTVDRGFFSLTPKVVRDEILLLYPKTIAFDSENRDLGAFASLSMTQADPNVMPQAQSTTSSNLLFASLLEGGYDDSGKGIDLGPDGSIFVTGDTQSLDFPGVAGFYDVDFSGGYYDAFVAKLDPSDGHIIYATYLGGSGDDVGATIAVNENGEAYVAGGTSTPDFPLLGNPIQSSPTDGFLVKLNATGTGLLYSSYIGEPCPNSCGTVVSMAMDVNENIYMLTREQPSAASSGTGTARKLIPGSSVYEYSHSLGNGAWWSMAVDINGHAYFAGRTNANPSVALAASIDEMGAEVYSISIGEESQAWSDAWSVAVDEDGYAYITGRTVVSFDFPAEGRPLTDPGPSGTQDSFVTILEPSGAIKYSSYLNMGYSEIGFEIAVDNQGSVYVTGSVLGHKVIDWFDLEDHVYMVKLIPVVPRENYWLSYPELIGGSENEWPNPNAGVVDSAGNVYITGETNSPDFPGSSGTGGGYYEAFVVKVSTSQLFAQLPEISTVSYGSGTSCFTAYNTAIGYKAGPINTSTGSYDYSIRDLSILTSAGELAFQREYASLNYDLASPLSNGWTHNHDIRLILPTDPEGKPDTILFKAQSANQYVFAINSDGTYSAYPGLCATLVTEQGSYVLKDGGQKTYTFNAAGKLLSYSDAQGHTWNYVYDIASGKLDRINADGGAQYLLLHYDPQGRIDNVSDQTGRSVTYYYDPNGDLTSVDDVLGQTWSYEYYVFPPHLLTRVAAPGNVTIEQTTYYTDNYPDVKAWQQFDGEGNLVVELIYNADGTTTIKDVVNDANPEIHGYDERGTLRIQENSDGGEQGKDYDPNFRPNLITDPLGNQTDLTWSENGVSLTHIEDALHQHTNIIYGEHNNPLELTDPLTYKTKYFYNNTNFPNLPTRIEYPLSFDGGTTYIGIDYTYYPPSSGASAGKVELVTDALGQKTHYTYTASGQPDIVITAYQTPNARITDSDYDDLGRLIKLTDPAGVITRSKYDAAGRRTVTIHNVDPSTPNDENPPQNLVSGDNIYNIYTRYYYDARGNQIGMVNTDWTITRTYYDLANRPIGVVQNLVINSTPANSDADVITAINTSFASVPAYTSVHPDWNIRTETEYDEVGNVIITRDAQGIISRTYYDEAHRPKLDIQNWAGAELYGDITTAPSYNPANPDQNIRTEYFYDLNNNLIANKDTLGVITRTYYDELNRPEIVVQHLTGQDILVETPPERGTDSNIRSDTYYDANGNVIATVDPRGVITRIYYDALNRPIAVVENLVGKLYTDPTLPDPGQGDCGSEANICTFTYYDEAGNSIATVDPRGVVSRAYYDASNRPVTIVQNLVGQSIYATTPPAPGSTDQNIRTDIAYDQDGRRDTTTNPLGHVTKYDYNDAGQLLKTTVNYVNGGIPQNEDDQRNIVTTYAYDALGRQIRTTDTLGRVNLSAYDDLGRLTSVTQNYLQGQSQNYKDASGDQYNLITTYSYDARGNQIAVTDTNGMISRTYYDALVRPVSVVRNLVGQGIWIPFPPERANPPSSAANLRTDTFYLGNGNTDYIVDEIGEITDYSFDNLGRLITTIDPISNPTSFEYDPNGNRSLITTFKTETESSSAKYQYDNLNRLTAVIENFKPGINPDVETNVTTTYTYDASGNRLSIRDGESHLEGIDYRTTFAYDALGRLETETDPLGNVTAYGYDAMGNRVSLFDANEKETIFGYDELNRLELIDYPAPDADVTFDYDALGRRQSMNDGLGSTSWDYNNLDLPVLITDPFSIGISYDYDELGNRTVLSYGAQTINYEYDDVSRLFQVTGTGLSAEVEYGYDAMGRLKTITRPNGVDTLYNYYDNGWLQDITHFSGTTTLGSYQYEYYKNGNRKQVIEDIQYPQLASIPSNTLASARPSGVNTNSVSLPQKAMYNSMPQRVDFRQLPLSFVPNAGQWDQEVKFQTNTLGGSIYFTSSEVVLALMDKKIQRKNQEDNILSSAKDNSKVARIEYKNAEKNPKVEGVNLQPGVANFMIGSDKKKWVANAPMYGGVVYRDIYPGIDLTYEGAGNSLKSTFTVDPGVDPALIQWKHKNAADVSLDAAGNLLITLVPQKAEQTNTTLIEHMPVAWQEVNGQRSDVPVEYALAQNGEIRFVFPQGYDASLPLTIDPTLTYSTYLGEIGTDVGTAITTDSSGNVYVTGYSWCGNFPVTTTIPGVPSGSSEAIISKISADGNTLLYSTCVGGSGEDRGVSIALDTQARIVVGGTTDSTDLPIVSGIATYGGGSCTVDAPCQDNFILALNADGSAIRYSTYLGGDGREELGDIAVDGEGNILAVGSTTSTNFPTTNAYDNTYSTGGTCSSTVPCYDITVTRIDPDLSGTNAILYGTYLGENNVDRAYGMTLDASGKVYLTGLSESDGYPTTTNALQSTRKGDRDIVVSVIDPSLSNAASLVYSTYFGSTGYEVAFGIARDGNGNIYLTGRTSSSKFPLRDPLQYLSHSGSCSSSTCYEAFVTKLDISTNTLVYSTYLGGGENDEANGIVVDPYGRAYVAGSTRSSNFPVFAPLQAVKGADSCNTPPCEDAFLSVLEPDGQAFAYSTYLGGDQIDIANGIAIDSSNNIYLVGETFSANFPVTPGAYDVTNTDSPARRDAFISKVSALSEPTQPTSIHLDVPVSVSSDDAEESASGSSVNLTSTTLELTQATTNQKVGIRFANVELPQGAVIENAWIQFTANAANADVTSLTVQAEASDDAPTFVASATNISSRARTTASVAWTPAAWNTADEGGPDQRTPDLASVIQEVVDRSGWASGNALAFIITGTGKRVAKTYDRDTYGAPYLHIEYTVPPSSQLGLQITPNTTTFTGTGQSIAYTYTLTNTGAVALNGPYAVSDDKVPAVDCSSATSPLAVGASTTCTGSYTTTPADVTAGSVVNYATALASDGVGTVTSNLATATVVFQVPSGPVTITYDYDALNRLTAADYDNGDYYHYTYDAVGNRKTQARMLAGLLTNTIYDYDDANRLVEVNGVTYTWDGAGNLLSDGGNTYTYDSANRLKTLTQGTNTYTFSYNGLGDRLVQNGTHYTLDLNAGLTQVLSDGTNTYLYGLGRIAEQQGGVTEYYLGDALGSVRQLANSGGSVALARNYDPFGSTRQTIGDAQTDYGFTGEFTDPSGLIHLRARYYDALTGRFTTRDTWEGNVDTPASLNRFNYAHSNPVMNTDPNGNYCIAGIDIDFLGGRRCTDADRELTLRVLNRLKSYFTSPDFVLGVAYEVIDALLVGVGPETARLAWSLILKANPVLDKTAQAIAISAALCGNTTPQVVLNLIKNGIQGSDNFMDGRVVGRVTVLAWVITQITVSVGGAAILAAAGPFTFGIGFGASAIAVSITPYAAAVGVNIAVKELADHLLYNAITGKGGGGGGAPVPRPGDATGQGRVKGTKPPSRTSGIYEYIDQKTGKWYVGETDDLYTRLRTHINKKELASWDDVVWTKIQTSSGKALRAAERFRYEQISKMVGGPQNMTNRGNMLSLEDAIQYFDEGWPQTISSWPNWLTP